MLPAFETPNQSIFLLLALTLFLIWLWFLQLRAFIRIKLLPQSQNLDIELEEMCCFINIVILTISFFIILFSIVIVRKYTLIIEQFFLPNYAINILLLNYSFMCLTLIILTLKMLVLKIPIFASISCLIKELIIYQDLRLQFDLKRIKIRWIFWGFKYSNTIKFSDILKIENIPFQYIKIESELETYTLGDQLTQLERDWLFNQIASLF